MHDRAIATSDDSQSDGENMFRFASQLQATVLTNRNSPHHICSRWQHSASQTTRGSSRTVCKGSHRQL